MQVEEDRNAIRILEKYGINSPEKLMIFRGFVINSTNLKKEEIAQKYFRKQSVVNQEKHPNLKDNKWPKSFAGKPLFGVRIKAETLEPFVARYVNAVNSIGAKTCSSCDAWDYQNNDHMFIVFKERYSMFWHQIIYEKLNLKSKWVYKGLSGEIHLPSGDENKIKKYVTLNQDADVIEKNQKQMLVLKGKVIEKLKRKQKTNLSDAEIKRLLIQTIKEIESI